MFQSSNTSKRLEIVFSAVLENVDRAAEETEKFLIAKGLENISFKIILGMREALVNAIIHGCGKVSRKMIRYDLQLEDDFLTITVEDQGNGFDWMSCLKADLPSMKDSGRGLSIMKKYFSDIKYNEKGNRLVLRTDIAKPTGGLNGKEKTNKESN